MSAVDLQRIDAQIPWVGESFVFSTDTARALVAEVRALRAKVEAVEALANEWRDGHEPVHHFGYIADIERALDGVEFPGQPRPTPETDWCVDHGAPRSECPKWNASS